MIAEEVKQLLAEKFPNALVNVKGEGENFSVDIISPLFAELNTINRKKAILSCVKDKISTGEIHAFSVQAYTAEEWQQQNSNKLTVL